jgi:acetylornithine/succinyldiaminopimelate/putrescine aminotransferase
VYGNTMTTNPRALDVACAVLDMVTPELRANVRERGREAIALLEAAKAEIGGMITKVQGTGLLFSCELSSEFKGYGVGSTEEWLREHGIGVIHGGANSLRFTPHFTVGRDELELMVSMVKRALREGPRQQQAAAA